MTTAKEIIRDVVETQPDDASCEAIMREIAFERMVAKGLEDARNSRVVENGKMERRILQWRS